MFWINRQVSSGEFAFLNFSYNKTKHGLYSRLGNKILECVSVHWYDEYQKDDLRRTKLVL